MDYDNKAKNYYSSQDTSLEEKSFKLKTFNLFYEISRVKQYNLWTLSILYLLETIQLISYAFDEPHKSVWKIKSDNIDMLSTILGATRIVSLMQYLNFTIYIVIFIFLIILILGLFLFLLMEMIIIEIQTKFFEQCTYITNTIINPLSIFLGSFIYSTKGFSDSSINCILFITKCALSINILIILKHLFIIIL